MFLTKHIVVDVVSWSHLQAARTELNVDVLILDDWNHAVHQRHDDFLAFQMLILRVVRVDTHGGVAHDCLRTCCSHHCVTVFAFNLISEVEKLAMFFFINDFLVAQGCQCFRVPVDHTHAAVDKAFFIKVAEHADD